MNKGLHLLFSLFTAIVLALVFDINGMFVFLVMFFCNIPDLDIKIGDHRKTFHNLFFIFIFSIFVSIILSILIPKIFPSIPKLPIFLTFSASLYGLISHIFLDFFSVKGVWIFYPIWDRPFCQGGFLRLGVPNSSFWSVVQTTVLIIVVSEIWFFLGLIIH